MDHDTMEELATMLAAGMEPPDIADELQVPIQQVYNWMSETDLGRSTRELRNAELIESYTSGDPVLDIVSTYRVSTATLYRILRENGVPLRGRTYPEGTSPEDIQKLYNQNMPVMEIAAKTGRSLTFIYAHVEPRRCPR